MFCVSMVTWTRGESSRRRTPLWPRDLTSLGVVSPDRHPRSTNKDRKEMFYLTTHSTHFNAVIWQRAIQIAREETCCCHYMSYSFQLAAKVLLYAPSDRLCYTSHGALFSTCTEPITTTIKRVRTVFNL